MRKEVILAVIIGVLLGGIILYGINLANNSSTDSVDTEDQGNNSQVAPTSTKKNGNLISITTPQNNAVVTETTLSLKGSAKANSNIAIVTENDDILTVADANGYFSSDINLISGENIITVTSVDTTQSTASASITVIRTATLPE